MRGLAASARLAALGGRVSRLNVVGAANLLVRALVDGATPSARVSWVDCGRRFEKGAGAAK